MKRDEGVDCKDGTELRLQSPERVGGIGGDVSEVSFGRVSRGIEVPMSDASLLRVPSLFV